MSIKYYPFFRAKQYEVIAVANMSSLLAANGKVLPVFEPVKDPSTTLLRQASVFGGAGLEIGLLLNPDVGDFIGSTAKTTKLMTDMRRAGAVVVPAFSVNAQTQPGAVTSFLSAHPGKVIFMHQGAPSVAAATVLQSLATPTIHMFFDGATGHAYQSAFPAATRVLLRDGFQAKIKNADYPPQSFFGDLHLNYTKAYSGFGDFATIGYRFSAKGGPAYAVAIHMTEDAGTQGILCNHYLSTSNLTPTNPAGKFGEAVAALAAYVRANPGKIDFSAACQELLQANAAGTYPALGPVKRMSVQHHLELMLGLV